MTDSNTLICIAAITALPGIVASVLGFINGRKISDGISKTEEVKTLCNGNNEDLKADLSEQTNKVLDLHKVVAKLVDPNQPNPKPEEIVKALEPVPLRSPRQSNVANNEK